MSFCLFKLCRGVSYPSSMAGRWDDGCFLVVERDAAERRTEAERERGKKKNQTSGSEIREAAGILFVVVWDGENGLLEFVVAELLKRHGSGDGGKHGDV